ncbi:MAG: rod shape-determining protein RodA [Muribaculaceae bacterium]|nr:rod shape-determining protein RodA [Muribaculaceae bacterium]
MYSNANTPSSVFRYVDWITITIYAILVVAGAVSIYAASYDFDHASIFSFDEFSGKQLRWIGLSLILGFVILLTDYRLFETYAYPIYILMIAILAVTIVIAPDIKGSRSWLVFGPVSMQPAEFAKFATSLALAKLFSGYNFTLNARMSNYVRAFTIILLPILLIFLQKETGSALAYLALFFVLYREGMSGLVLLAAVCAVVIFVVTVKFTGTLILGVPSGVFFVLAMTMVVTVCMMAVYVRDMIGARNLFIWYALTVAGAFIAQATGLEFPGLYVLIGSIAAGCLYIVFLMFRGHVRKLAITILFALGAVGFLMSVNVVFDHMADHQKNRILVALGITEDPRGAGYNVNQSVIAIGSGGMTGKGFLNGTQTKLKYVPEQHTDFIFCTIGEEEGFLGTTAVLGLFVILILRIVSLAERQPTTFARVYGYCVASFLIFHLLINVGMVIGLCPVIGIPLPFFSYGGSSLWGFTILLFIMLRLDAARREHHTY